MYKHPLRKLPKASFFAYAARCLTQRRAAGQHSTADLYRTVSNHLSLFCRGKPLYLHEITAGLVGRFIAYLKQTGLKPNSIRTYISQFRALCNQARREGKMRFPDSGSPFEGYPLRRGETASRALPPGTLPKLLSAVPEKPAGEGKSPGANSSGENRHEANRMATARAADYALFSFLACGMPFVDLAHLTAANIQGNDLVYRRHKTGTLIRIGLTSGMRRILQKYADPASPYLFPIFPAGREVTHEGYKAILRRYNRELKKLGECLRLPVPLTSYVFRHTWATEALRVHTPIAVISQALGHTSEKTTRFYLASIEQSEMNRMNERVVGEVDRLVVTKGFT